MIPWQIVYDNIYLPTTKIVYVAVGCCMDRYTEITSENNQQYPCFLNRFPQKQVIILIDPNIEDDLRIVHYWESQGSPLNQIYYDNNIPSELFRHYENHAVTVFAIKASLNYEIYPILTSSEKQKTFDDIAIIYNMISLCLSKVVPTKFILQDYTGRDTTNFYIDTMNIFGRNEVMKNVIFDVTQDDGGCFISIQESMIEVDSAGDFVHEKFMRLSMLKGSQHYRKQLTTRIDVLLYPITWCYIKMLEDKSFSLIDKHKIKQLTAVYEVEWVEDVVEPEYHIDVLKQLIDVILQDICEACDVSYDNQRQLKELITKESRPEFINGMVVLKSL